MTMTFVSFFLYMIYSSRLRFNGCDRIDEGDYIIRVVSLSYGCQLEIMISVASNTRS